jgi:hypothetical protein
MFLICPQKLTMESFMSFEKLGLPWASSYQISFSYLEKGDNRKILLLLQHH